MGLARHVPNLLSLARLACVPVLVGLVLEAREDVFFPLLLVAWATDDIAAVAEVAKEEDLYFHVDAAWAGSAMICPEIRPIWDGVELADSIVFNPHKWLGANFDYEPLPS